MSKSICSTSWSTPFHQVLVYHWLLSYFPVSPTTFLVTFFFWTECPFPNNFQSSPYFLQVPSSSFPFHSFTALASVNAFNKWIPFSIGYLFPLHLNQIISLPHIYAVWCHHCYREKTILVFVDDAQTAVWIPAQQTTSKNSNFWKNSRGKFWNCTHFKQEVWSVTWLTVWADFSHNKENLKRMDSSEMWVISQLSIT